MVQWHFQALFQRCWAFCVQLLGRGLKQDLKTKNKIMALWMSGLHIYWVYIEYKLTESFPSLHWKVLLLCHNTLILCCHNNNKSNSLVKKVQRWCGTFFKCIHVLPLHSWPPHLLNSRETWFRLGSNITQTCTVQRAYVYLFNFPYAVLFTSA